MRVLLIRHLSERHESLRGISMVSHSECVHQPATEPSRHLPVSGLVLPEPLASVVKSDSEQRRTGQKWQPLSQSTPASSIPPKRCQDRALHRSVSAYALIDKNCEVSKNQSDSLRVYHQIDGDQLLISYLRLIAVAVHGVRMLRLACVPVGDPGPGARRGLHRPQHRQHGPALRQEQVLRRWVGHRVRRLCPQGWGHRGDWPQPLRWNQGTPLTSGWRTRRLPLRRGLGQDRLPREEEGADRVRLIAFR